MLGLGLLFCVVSSDALAQYASNIRLTNPIGRTVLEIRKGTQPANPRLLFTAVITAGPTGGTTSLLLQQAYLRDIFNPAAPAAAWITVRSSLTAFSLGGGCGRNNLIDFPFINNSRPEILRITGTTHQVITLGIAGNDQYDSIDCGVQGDGDVLYVLTNRTRNRMELRREQGGLLQLVRDDFGAVITPFSGGIRPSISRFRPRGVLLAGPRSPAGSDDAAGAKGGPDPLERWVLAHMARSPETPTNAETRVILLRDVLDLPTDGSCTLSTFPAPTAFSIPRDTTVVDGVVLGATRNTNILWGDYFFVNNGGCTQTSAPESFGAAGPWSLYTWTAVAGNTVSGNTTGATSGGAPLSYTTLVLANSVITQEGTQRNTQSSPFAGRGGPVTSCPLFGSENDGTQLLIGPGPSNVQVQHSTLSINLAETVSNSGFEDAAESTSGCE